MQIGDAMSARKRYPFKPFTILVLKREQIEKMRLINHQELIIN